jgi:hypothetical protein
MVGYAILIVGAASSRDHVMIAIAQLLIAAESRSHTKSRYFGEVSHEDMLLRIAKSLYETSRGLYVIKC